jgi:hypothetical protein
MHQFDRGRGSLGQRYFAAPNPPRGAIITYYMSPQLLTAPEEEGEEWTPPTVAVRVLDGEGNLVRNLEPKQGKDGAGVQRLVWDLRHPLSYQPTEEQRYNFFTGVLKGPFVLPGRYQIQLQVADRQHVREVEVRGDPMISLTPQDRRDWHDTLLALDQMIATSNALLTTLEKVRSELKEAQVVIEESAQAHEDLISEAGAIDDELDSIRKAMEGEATRSRAEQSGPPPIAEQLIVLYRNMAIASAPPTEDQRRLTHESHRKLGDQVQKLNTILTQSLPALWEKLAQEEIRWTPGRLIPLPPELPKM